MRNASKLLLKGAILFSFVLLAQGVVFQVFAEGDETPPDVELKAGNPCHLEDFEIDGFVCQGGQWLENLPEGPQNIGDVLDIIRKITNWVFAVLMAISVIMIVLAGAQLIMEGKDPAKVTEAKDKVLYAIGGMAIAVLAKGFESGIRNLLGL